MMLDVDLEGGAYGRSDAADGYTTAEDLSGKQVGYAALAAGAIALGIGLYKANESGSLDEFKEYMTRPNPDGRAVAAIRNIESGYTTKLHHMMAADMARVVQDSEDGVLGDYTPNSGCGWELKKAIESGFEYSPKHGAAAAVARYLQVDGDLHDGDFSAWIEDRNYIWHER